MARRLSHSSRLGVPQANSPKSAAAVSRQGAERLTDSRLPRLAGTHQALKPLARRRLIKHCQKMRVSLLVYAYQRLVQKRLFRCAAGGINHEIRPGLAVRLGCPVDECANIIADTQIHSTSRMNCVVCKGFHKGGPFYLVIIC